MRKKSDYTSKVFRYALCISEGLLTADTIITIFNITETVWIDFMKEKNFLEKKIKQNYARMTESGKIKRRYLLSSNKKTFIFIAIFFKKFEKKKFRILENIYGTEHCIFYLIINLFIIFITLTFSLYNAEGYHKMKYYNLLV